MPEHPATTPTAPTVTVPAAGPLDGSGTPESAWLPWLGQQHLPAPDLPDVGSLVVLAPHPDDEVLGVGGLMADLSRRGWGVEVVAVTDGEASHPHSRRTTPETLAVLRRHETAAALTALGLPEGAVHHLGLPDGGVSAHEGALLEALTDLVADPAPTVLVHPHPADGHPDHDAVARVAAGVGDALGLRRLAYPVWLWHHRRPGTPEDDWAHARSHWLSLDAQRAKAAAIGCFSSQIHPLGLDPADAAILPPAILRRFHRPFEVLFTCPVPGSARTAAT